MKHTNFPTESLYSKFPYPDDGVVRTTVSTMLWDGLKKYTPLLITKDGLKILDIGCGTGEATIGIALRFPNAQVTGIDINRISVEKARQLLQKQRKKVDVNFQEADILGDVNENILNLGRFGAKRKFDVIVSMGVLHHLDDPRMGFSKVRELIEDDGIFLCGVYSKLGRWNDIAVREILDRIIPLTNSFITRMEMIKQLKLSQKHGVFLFLRNLVNRIRFGPSLNFLELIQVYLKRKKVVHISDTFSNPHEHMFYFKELMHIFDETRWSFISLADGAGLPTTVARHTRDQQKVKLLEQFPKDALFDYLALHYQLSCFCFFLKPKLGR